METRDTWARFRLPTTPGTLGPVEGWIPQAHISPLDQSFSDPIAVAELFLGTPYVWGGNSSFGIDCSGLVQAA
ncbi:MAG: NlpC/P60 family protein, partial [Maritimibacter sp.]